MDIVPPPGTELPFAVAPDWLALRRRANTLLRNPQADDFLDAIEQLHREAGALLDTAPDRALLVLVHTASHDKAQYSANHALLVMAVCQLAATKVLAWSEAQRHALTRAALTMNLAMTALQDSLAVGEDPPTAAERKAIAGHAAAAAALLRDKGVTDALWLEAIEHHHDRVPGPLAGRTPGMQLARLLQRADHFAARLSPRRSRKALSAAAAARGAYLDENGKPDEAGMALVKAIGIYPPGTLVELASRETGAVVRRGSHAGQPVVAVVAGRNGLLIDVPLRRDSAEQAFAIRHSMAPQELPMRVALSGLLQLA